MEISFADELDEMWTDELWELGNQLDSGTSSWWILKPSMADRGMGIRLFNSKLGLSKILEDFETEGSEPDAGSDNNAETPESTDVVLSQLRHFVVQV
jgi:tubulin--tyrosine ligase